MSPPLRGSLLGVLALLVPALFAVALPACGSPIAMTPAACTPATAFPTSPASPSASGLATVVSAAGTSLDRMVAVEASFSTASLLGGVCSAARGTGSIDLPSGEGTLTLRTSAGHEYRFVFAGQDVFVHLPASAARSLPAGRQWVDAPFPSPSDPGYREDAVVFFAQVAPMNPRYLLELVQSAALAVDRGVPAVDGTRRVERFRATVDLSRAAASLSGPYALAFSDALAPYLATGTVNHNPPTTSTTLAGNPWLTAQPSRASPLMDMVVDVAGDGSVARISGTPPSAQLGDVVMTLSTKPGGAAALSVPDSGTMVNVRALLGTMGEGRGESGSG